MDIKSERSEGNKKFSEEAFARSRALLGEPAFQRLVASHVLLFGLGGVGGYACDALARSGVGTLSLVDMDRYAFSNLNRQPGAFLDSIGLKKTEVMARRIRGMRGDGCQLFLFSERVEPQKGERFFQMGDRLPDLVIDAIDDMDGKLEIIRLCALYKIPLLLCGGCGRRLDPSKLRFAELSKTSDDPLLKRLRRLCREKQYASIETLYSIEAARSLIPGAEGPSSMIFVPASAGLMLASRAVSFLCEGEPVRVPVHRPPEEK